MVASGKGPKRWEGLPLKTSDELARRRVFTYISWALAIGHSGKTEGRSGKTEWHRERPETSWRDKNYGCLGLASRGTFPCSHATSTTKELCPQSSYRKGGENDELINGLQDDEPAFPRNPDEGLPVLCLCGKSFKRVRGMKVHRTKMGCLPASVRRPSSLSAGSVSSAQEVPEPIHVPQIAFDGGTECVCGRRFKSIRGMNVHKTKMGCQTAINQRSASTKEAGNTSDYAGPEANHSPDKVSDSEADVNSEPKTRIKFPKAIDTSAWSTLDLELTRLLKAQLRENPQLDMKTFSEIIYKKCFDSFGVVQKNPVHTHAAVSRRQREIEKLKKERKKLRRQWRIAEGVEKVGLSELWWDVKKSAPGSQGCRKTPEKEK